MADITHPLYPGVTVNTDTAVKDPDLPLWKYPATVNGRAVTLPGMNVSPQAMVSGHGDDKTNAYVSLAAALKPLSQSAASTGDRGILEETVGPALQKGAANFLGFPADLANTVLGAVDTGINAARYAASGFEDNTFDQRILSSDPKKVIGGSEQIARGFTNIGDLARAGTRATQEAGLNVTLPEWVDYITAGTMGGKEVGARTFFDIFSFDMNPDESTKAQKYVSLIAQIAAGAPMEGAVIAKLAVQLAKTPDLEPTKKAVYEALSEMQVNNPKAAAGMEALMGTAAGTGMVTSIEALEAAYPDAPQWMKNTVAAGGGILLPMAAATGGKVAYDATLSVPVLRFPARVLENALSSLTSRGAYRAASRANQADGGDWKSRSRILTATDHLRFAISQGKDIDPDTRIAYTTPQLASNEARILEAQIKSGEASGDLSGAELESQLGLLKGLRTFAAFQDRQLKTIAEGTDSRRRGAAGSAIDFYARYSERMLDRRDSIFNALDQTVLKLDPVGLPSPTRGDNTKMTVESDWSMGGGAPGGFYLYKENRLRAIK